MTERMTNAEGKRKINMFKGTGSAAGLNFRAQNDSLHFDLKITCNMQRAYCEGAAGYQLSRVAFNVTVFPLLYNSCSALWIKKTNKYSRTDNVRNNVLQFFVNFLII